MDKIDGITEDDIANYLANTPGFFERHAELLASVELANPHGPRAISLQQRQMEMLRERIRGLERRMMEMIRHGQENAGLMDRLYQWTRMLMLVDDRAALPETLRLELQDRFLVPQTALRLWDLDPALALATDPAAAPAWAGSVSPEARHFANGLTVPYCGPEAAFEATRWLDQPGAVASLALVALRRAAGAPAFGLLVLASPDPVRYGPDLGTEFLVRVGELASAALHRLLPPGA